MADKSSAFSASSLLNTAHGEKVKFRYLRSFFKDTKKFAPYVFLLVLASAGGAYTFVKLPELFGRLADMFLNVFIASVIKNESALPVGELLAQNAAIGVYMLLNAAFSYLQGSFSTRITSGSAHVLRAKVFEKIGTVKTAYTDVHSKSSVFETATSWIDVQNRSLNIFISQVISSVFLIAAVLIKIFSMDVAMGVTVAAVIPLQILVCGIINYADNAVKPRNRVCAPDISEVCESIDGLKRSGDPSFVMRLINESEKEKARLVKLLRFTRFARGLPSVFFTGVFSAVAIIIGSDRINDGFITVGTVISVIVYMRRLLTPLSQITSFFSSVKQCAAATDEIYSFINAPDEYDENGSLTVPDSGGIVFKNVWFCYPSGEKYVFRDFSTHIPARGITVLSGATGAGKSTAVKLIMRLYSPDRGEMLLNGVPFSDIGLSSFRSAFSVIPQDAGLFDGGVRYNIIYPDEKADMRRYKAACECAGIDFADEGTDESKKDGSAQLTEGQKQQVLIARAFYHRARFLIFDEAFSHADPAAEKRILNALRNFSQDSAVIFISHNNSDTDIPGAHKIYIG